MKREPGYYWIKVYSTDGWIIARWIDIDSGTEGCRRGIFLIGGSSAKWSEEAFAVIHPQKLTTPDEKQG